MHIQMRRSREECVAECEGRGGAEFYVKCIAKAPSAADAERIERCGVYGCVKCLVNVCAKCVCRVYGKVYAPSVW